MHGLLLIDKPAGLSSHDVVRQVRRTFKTRKVGHAGTLDPLATGVLPVAIGEGTKLLQFLLAEDKSYRATMRLGVTTDTLDSEGEILSENEVPQDIIQRLVPAMEKFVGMIDQVPPMYSALKRDGVPLYKLARAGKVVDRPARQIRIDRCELISMQLPELTLEVDCSKGTYIRSLCADLGEALGCGAHLTALCRLRTGQYSLERCLPLAQVDDILQVENHPAFLSIDEALFYYPALELAEPAVTRLSHGVPPQQTELTDELSVEPGEIVRLVSSGSLLAMARYVPNRSTEKRGDFELIRCFNRAQ
jgi:tRNA pseudouridine55 synthase